MAQHDFSIANQTFPATRSDLNNALEALATLSSGPTAPTTTYSDMLWYDTANNILKMRSEADDAWLSIGYLDQSANAFRILDDTQVVNTSGTQTGLLGDQATSAWEAGTSTTESLVSPAKVKAAVDTLALTIGVGQTWQDVSASRSGSGTSYQNTTGKPIMVSIQSLGGAIDVSSDGTNWVELFFMSGDRNILRGAQFIVPNLHYYRLRTSTNINNWAELR